MLKLVKLQKLKRSTYRQADEGLGETLSPYKMTDQRNRLPLILNPETGKMIIDKHNSIVTRTTTNKRMDNE